MLRYKFKSFLRYISLKNTDEVTSTGNSTTTDNILNPGQEHCYRFFIYVFKPFQSSGFELNYKIFLKQTKIEISITIKDLSTSNFHFNIPEINLKSGFKQIILGIRGAKGAPLPRLCFAQLALVFCFKVLLFSEKHYVTHTHTHRRTDRHMPTII